MSLIPSRFHIWSAARIYSILSAILKKGHSVHEMVLNNLKPEERGNDISKLSVGIVLEMKGSWDRHEHI